MLRQLSLLTLLLAAACPVHAVSSLLDIYSEALAADPRVQIAQYKVDVGKAQADSAFGALLPEARKKVHGRKQRGVPADGSFNWGTGRGYVAPAEGQYTRAEQEHGVDVRCLLFSVFGGFSPRMLAGLPSLGQGLGVRGAWRG